MAVETDFALERVRERLEAARQRAAESELDMAALDLQEELSALGAMTGRSDVAEETLASIFARFCVGK